MTWTGEQEYALSEAQKDFYWKNGYLVIKDLIDMETLNMCKQHFIDICDGKADKGNMTVMKEQSLINSGLTGERLINKIQDILHDPVFSRYTEHPRLLAAAAALLGPALTAVHSMLINKPPAAAEHPPHQDIHYFPFGPGDAIVGAWTAIDAADEDNGCLFVVPGSHRPEVLHEHSYLDENANKMYHGIRSPVFPRRSVPLAPGDTIIFHPYLVHGSGRNVSQM